MVNNVLLHATILLFYITFLYASTITLYLFPSHQSCLHFVTHSILLGRLLGRVEFHFPYTFPLLSTLLSSIISSSELDAHHHATHLSTTIFLLVIFLFSLNNENIDIYFFNIFLLIKPMKMLISFLSLPTHYQDEI